MTHHYEYECENRDGLIVGWAACDCGWTGPEETNGSSHRHHIAYQAHVELELGEAAFYSAPVGCVNCGYEGPAQIVVGTSVWSATCPMCCVSGRLRPNNEFKEREDATKPRMPW